MVLASRVRDAFGTNGLRRVEQSLFLSRGIDPLDAEFLSVVGVPREEQLEIEFNLLNELPRLDDLARRGEHQAIEKVKGVLCLNAKYNLVIAVDKDRGGVVLAVDLEQKFPEIFVNSRIRFLVGFMAEGVLHWVRWTRQGIPRNESSEILLSRMHNLDPAALQENAWWDLTIQQMKDGLL